MSWGGAPLRLVIQGIVVLALATIRSSAQLWTSCHRVIAIPGNPYNVDDPTCAPCANGAQTWYPCDDPSLCYCHGTTIPPQYLLPFSNCSNVVAVPAQFSATDAQCAVCNDGLYRWWPCEAQSVGVLCQCSVFAPPATAVPTDASTARPPTAAPPTDIPTTGTPAIPAPITTTTPTTTVAPPTDTTTGAPTDVPSSTTATPQTEPVATTTESAFTTDIGTAVPTDTPSTASPSTTTTTEAPTTTPGTTAVQNATPAPTPTPSATPTELTGSSAPITAAPIATLEPSPAPPPLPSPTVPTTEPSLPPGVAAPITVAGSLAFAQRVDELRRRHRDLRDAIAAAAQVQPEAVTILSILPGSTIVRFEIETQRSSADIGASLAAALESPSTGNATAGSALKVFMPILDTLTLKQSSGKALFAIGIAFYAGIALAGLAFAAALSWSAYRRRYPDVRTRAKPTAVVSGGAIRIQFGPEDEDEEEQGDKILDGRDANGNDLVSGDGCSVGCMALGATRALTQKDIILIAARRRPTPGEEAVAWGDDWLKCTEEYYDVEAVGVVAPFPADGGLRQQQPIPLVRTIPQLKIEPSSRIVNRRHSPAGPRGRADAAEKAVDMETKNQLDVRRESERRVTFAVRMAQLQPSREVIDDDLTASYAIV